MDVHRLNSTPLAQVDSEAHGNNVAVVSPVGSPKAHSGRLPSFFKTLKAKLGSLGTSRSAVNLCSLATTTLDARGLPGHSPPMQVAVICKEGSSSHWHCSRSQSSILPGISPDSAPARQDAASLGQADPAKDICMDSSPFDISALTNLLLDRHDSSSEEVSSSATSKRPFSSRLAPSPPAPKAAAPQSDTTESPTQNSFDKSTPGATFTTNRKLLAVSPALPSSMRRTVWTLEDYSIIRRLFKGASSAVYRATCRRSGLPVALKVYFLSRVAPNVLHMLKREIEIHTQLVHRHVARLYAAFMDESNRVVLVQEYAAQGDLYGVMQRVGGRMRPDQVSDAVIRPFLDALSYMHSKGICHRDIKPENILFTHDWRLLVADFGVSIDLNQERAVTRAGTEGYMAPEVERCPLKANPNDNKDDPRYAYSAAVDIWAVGVLAYELMVGFPPVIMPSAAPAGGTGAPAADPAAASPDATTPTSDSLSGFVRSQMTPAALHFPASVPPLARDFVLAALATDPLERPTATQLLRHPWLQQQQQIKAVVAASAAAATQSTSAMPASGVAVAAAAVGSPRPQPAAGSCPAAVLRTDDLLGMAASGNATAGAVVGSPVQLSLLGGSRCAGSSALCTPA